MSDEATPTTTAPVSESSQETKVEGTESTTKTEPKPEKKYRTIKVDGVEERVDEDEVWADVNKYRSADKKFKEAAATKKQMQNFIRAMKEDPESVLSDPRLGIDLDSLAEQRLRKKIERELMDPRDVKAQELEKELKSFRDRDQDERTKREQSEHEQAVQASQEEIATTLNKVIESSVLAKDPTTLRAAAYYMKQALLQGVEVSPEQIISHIEGLQMKNYLNVAQKYSGEQLTAFLGEEIVKRLRQHDLETHRKTRQAPDPWVKPAPTEQAPSRPSRDNIPLDRHSANDLARKKLGL